MTALFSVGLIALTNFKILKKMNSSNENEPIKPTLDKADVSGSANEDEPWYEAEDCEECAREAEEDGIEYEHNFTWENDTWFCDTCGRPQ